MHDERRMNMPELPPGNVRAYRTEVETFNPKYSHIAIRGGNAHIYNPKPDADAYENVGKGKKTP